MGISRRSFLTTGAAGAIGASVLGFDLQPLQAQSSALKISRTTQTRSTCPYCSVSCGVIIHTIGDGAKNVTPQVVHVEGDPDHPINRGTLCPKGSSLLQAIDEIATRTKALRDRDFIEQDANGKTVNRWESLAFAGGCTDTNEFNYLVVKSMRSMGVTCLENQARV